MLEAAAFQVRLEFLLEVSPQRFANCFAHGDKLGVVPLDELVEQRRLGPVTRVARRIDERWRTRARPLARHGFASLQWIPAGRLRSRLPTAKASLERALRLDPNNPEIWLELGEIELQTGNAAQAATMARKALTLAGRNSGVAVRAQRLLRAAE